MVYMHFCEVGFHHNLASWGASGFSMQSETEQLCSKKDFLQSTKSWLRLFHHLWRYCSFSTDWVKCDLIRAWKSASVRMWICTKKRKKMERKRGLGNKEREEKEAKIMFGSNEERWVLTNRVSEAEWRSCTIGPQITLIPSAHHHSYYPTIRTLIGSGNWSTT